jgi:hypothetical protein
MTNLPEALVNVFGISKSAREIIANVLKSPLYVMDRLLETQGIGTVPSIPPPPRVLPEESDEEVILTTEEAIASSRASRARSAPSREEASRPSTAISDHRNTPASSGLRDATPQFLPEPAHRFARSPTSEVFQQDNLRRSSAYQELLDNVIRIAGRTTLPHRNSIAQVGNGQLHEGFNHEAAFGIRTQAQMTHDIKIGAAGELFVRNFSAQIPFLQVKLTMFRYSRFY